MTQGTIQMLNGRIGLTISLDTPGLLDEMNRNKYYFMSARNIHLIIIEGVLNYLAKKEITKTFPQFVAGMPNVDYSYMEDPKLLSQAASITLQA